MPDHKGTELRGLLAEVVANPDNDLPRYILADWLDDQNTPSTRCRAELIRVQCALARLSPRDKNRVPLEARERDLLPRHPRRWARPFRHYVRSWGYRRGLVHSVRIDPSTLLAKADHLFANAPIEHLTLQARNLDPALREQPWLTKLRGLTLCQSHSCYGGSPFGIEELLLSSPLLTNIRELCLRTPPFIWQSTGIRHSIVPLLTATFLPTLECLDLLSEAVHTENLAVLNSLQTARKLNHLRLHLAGITPPNLRIAGAPNLTARIETLELTYPELIRAVEVLRGATWPALRVLILHQTGTTTSNERNPGVRDLGDYLKRQHPRIEWVSLRDSGVTASAHERLADWLGPCISEL